MGLISSNTLNDYVTQTIPRNAKNIWEAVKRAPSDLRGLVSPEMNTQVRQAMNKPATLDKASAMQMAMDYLQTTNPMGGLLAHTVYHGSPHKFTKFDMSKIGTGEGAQAYGHGLYFAEAPDVAKSYIPPNAQAQETIASLLKKETARAQRYSNEGGMEVYEMFNKGYTPAGIRANIDNLIESGEAHPDYIKKMEQAYKKAIEIYKANPAGQMYKVDIPDEATPRMLDWDKPLSEQPEVLAKAKQLYDDLGELYPSVGEVIATPGIFDGQHLYQSLINSEKSSERAARTAKALGIPGIRYKDAMSRGTDAGTSNFVLFDDQLARILEINGHPTGLLSWADEAKKVKK